MTSEEVLAYFHQAAERAARCRTERGKSLSTEMQEQ